MNDPLKKYIADHRDEFDHLSPSSEVLQKLKSNLHLKKVKRTSGLTRMLVAATILVIASATYLILSRPATKLIETTTQYANNNLPKVIPSTTIRPITQYKGSKSGTKNNTPSRRNGYKTNSAGADILTSYRNLTDSTSASTRLSAILQIGKSSLISYDIVDKLAKTLNHDPNTNVRLAALNLLSRYIEDGYVASACTASLSYQQDPLVQLGLIALLSHTDNPKLDDKLYALANDPSTFSEVKDQAYFVLLNQNKL